MLKGSTKIITRDLPSQIESSFMTKRENRDHCAICMINYTSTKNPLSFRDSGNSVTVSTDLSNVPDSLVPPFVRWVWNAVGTSHPKRHETVSCIRTLSRREKMNRYNGRTPGTFRDPSWKRTTKYGLKCSDIIWRKSK